MDERKTVFVSYSSRDCEIVGHIVEQLKQMKVTYWKAPEMIPAGSSYAKEIPRAIQQSDVFLLVLSKESQDSIWVEKEVDSAICQRKTIIPIQIEELELNDTFRFYLNNVQMILYYENEENALAMLRGHLHVPDEEEEEEEEPSKPVVKQNTEVEKKVVPERTFSSRNRQVNAFRTNRIPIVCEGCGCEELEYIRVGIYRCTKCGKDNYDDFQKIRNFLELAGSASAMVIERETGVPRRTIDYFFRQEYLEIPSNSPDRVPCQRCGAPIRTGTLCEHCKSEQGKVLDRKSTKDKWHSFRQRNIGD